MILITSEYFYKIANNNYFKSYTVIKLALGWVNPITIPFGIEVENLEVAYFIIFNKNSI